MKAAGALLTLILFVAMSFLMRVLLDHFVLEGRIWYVWVYALITAAIATVIIVTGSLFVLRTVLPKALGRVTDT